MGFGRAKPYYAKLRVMHLAFVWLRVIFAYTGIIVGAICIVILLWWVPKRQTGHLVGVTPKERFELENEARTTLAQIIGGVFVLLGVFATWYTVEISQKTLGLSQENLKVAQQTLNVTQETQFTDRFTKAINQIGDKQLDVRLGGIYALERLGNESPEDRPAIVEVLTAYVRSHAPITSETGHRDCQDDSSFRVDTRNGKKTLRALDRPARTLWPPRDVANILEILGKGVITDKIEIGLNNTDLECAFLEDYHLENANMQHAHLENAWLVRTHLDGAFLMGSVATNGLFAGATFRDADVSGAHLEHTNNIDCGKLAEAKNLMGAHLPSDCAAAIAKQKQQENSYIADELKNE